MTLNRHVRAARDFLLLHADDYATAYAGFSWPRLPRYNFATEWFDGLAEENPTATALWVIDGPPADGQPADGPSPDGPSPDGPSPDGPSPDGNGETKLSYAQLRGRSVQAAQLLHDLGLRRGDRMLMVLGNCVALWELMLGAIRLGAVIIPATPQLSAADLVDRVTRGDARLLVAMASDAARFDTVSTPLGKLAVGGAPDGWLDYRAVDGYPNDAVLPAPGTSGDAPMLLYFTSGTTALPKLVEHTHTSYPIGHLSTMYWMGLRPGDVHLNISSPGWAKHAWSNVFTPWLASATVLVYNYARFDATALLDVLDRARVTTFCAPPTVWRMLVQTDLAAASVHLRECLSAGEPLNPEVIEQVRQAWGITIRDGYGQTETTAQVGNPPGQPLKPGSMGRPLPGYRVRLVDPATGAESSTEGELCLDLDPDYVADPAPGRPVALMTGYKEGADTFADDLNTAAFAGGVYHTGDVVSRDADGYLTYVGRADDLFKASDYRISPFELESVLIEHPAVAEAAVVPAPDEIRLAVPKAYVVLAAGWAPDTETARSILGYAREHLAPYQRIRRLEFAELPKTISGKIRRVELRREEAGRTERDQTEFRDTDFRWDAATGETHE